MSGSVSLANASSESTSFTMPEAPVSIQAEFALVDYSISVSAGTGGTASASATTSTYGKTITLTASPTTGYSFSKWTVKSGGATLSSETDANATFSMPASDVSIEAEFTAIQYAITVSPTNSNRGSITADPATAKVGDTVTLIAAPTDPNFTISSWNVVSGGVTMNGNTFVMPAGDVEIQGTYTLPTNMVGQKNSNGQTYLNESGALGQPHPGESDKFQIIAVGDDRTVNITSECRSSYLTFASGILQQDDIIYYDDIYDTGSGSQAHLSLISGIDHDIDADVKIVFRDTSLMAVASFLAKTGVGPTSGGNLPNVYEHASSFRVESGSYLFRYEQGSPGSWKMTYTDPNTSATSEYVFYQTIHTSGANYSYEMQFMESGNQAAMFHLYDTDAPGTRPY